VSQNDSHEPVTVTDKRRIDPDTGEIRPRTRGAEDHQQATGPAPSGAAPEATAAGAAQREDASASDELSELKSTLQRVKAEYDNYRKRTLRDQQLAAERTKVAVVTQLLPVLDDLDRARSHGDLESGPLKSVADKLATVLEGLGLSGFGRRRRIRPRVARGRSARGRGNTSHRRVRDAARIQGRRSGGAPRPRRGGRHRAGRR